MSDGQHDRHCRWTMRGRLALALVSARAETCPLKMCGRKRRCLARFGKPGDNFHTKLGACPIMDEVEWRAVSFGMQGACKLWEPWLRARAEAREAEEPKISWEERKRRYWLPEEVEKRAAAEQRRAAQLPVPYGTLVWEELRGEHVARPADVVAAGKQLIAFMAENGCRCALARRMRAECFDGCGEAAEESSAAAS